MLNGNGSANDECVRCSAGSGEMAGRMQQDSGDAQRGQVLDC